MSAALPSPERFFDTVTAYQKTAAIKAAIELGLFTAVAHAGAAHGKPASSDATEPQGATAAQIADRCKIHPRGARILADYLAILGFLHKSGQGAAAAYTNAPDAAFFLDRNSPAYCGGAVEFIASTHLRGHFDSLADRARHGGAPLTGDNSLAPNHDMWVRFARGMAGLAMGTAQMLTAQLLPQLPAAPDKPLKILDIAAGHGMYGIAFAQHRPHARITAQDWPNVLPVALEHAHALGVADRYTALPGSAFDVHFGADFDLILLPNFLHHFDAAANTVLLQKCHAALRPGGLCATLEFAPDDSRLSPPGDGAFALVMLATTPAGDAYTVNELTAMYKAAGFTSIQTRPLPIGMQSVITGAKA